MSVITNLVSAFQAVAAKIKENTTADATAQSRADAAYTLAESANSKAVSAYHYEGTVATFAELPNNLTTDNKGTVYNVGSDLDGMNYAWNGTGWDALGKVFTVANSITTDNGTALVPEGVAKTALAAKVDTTDLGDVTTDFVYVFNTAYAGSGTGA